MEQKVENEADSSIKKDDIKIEGLPDVAECPLKVDNFKVEAKILFSEAILDPEDDC